MADLRGKEALGDKTMKADDDVNDLRNMGVRQ
jgi:hypothetical protein